MSSKKSKSRHPGNARSEGNTPSASRPSKNRSNKKTEPGFKFPMHRLPLIVLFCVITFGGTTLVLMQGGRSGIKELGYDKVAEYLHDGDAFTQGLVYDGEFLYESTGNPKGYQPELHSSIRRVNMETGVPDKVIQLDDKYFGEGLTQVGDKFYQLTYKSQVCFVYDKDLNKIDEFKYDFYQGWGIAYDGKHLIISDGTEKLRFMDPETHEVVRELVVRTGKRKLYQLNELEYIGNRIYANVWKDDSIYIIDPGSGLVESRINLGKLISPGERRNQDAVLNGIAFNSKTGNLIVTGKLWPSLFEIKLKEQ